MAERIPLIYNPNADQIQEVGLEDQVSVGIASAQTAFYSIFYNWKCING